MAINSVVEPIEVYTSMLRNLLGTHNQDVAQPEYVITIVVIPGAAQGATGLPSMLQGEARSGDILARNLYDALRQVLQSYRPDSLVGRFPITLDMQPAQAASFSLPLAQVVESRVVGILPESVLQPHITALHWIKQMTGFSQERIARLVGVSRQTLHQWEVGKPIKDANRRCVYAVREVLERATIRHKTRELLAAWLDTPQGSEGQTPAQLIEKGEIARARLLATTSPSKGLPRPPTWVRRPIPEAFRAGAERLQQATPPESDLAETEPPEE